ncbi:hypothetical protein [Thermaerobacter subterraneus]|uniref:Uncharacterized protein n=1 Tax=Thermaerobacter subterraneus DSM 13965 TaxID=867903 RepID=K6PQL1_9FIRM|nr:hypothetical protein [Thermaerobacter subterraneus]EKP95232.1 hypothetical protein ThesuDRAFT_00974 [Thermaerobacter subterraneus DSM 13965]
MRHAGSREGVRPVPLEALDTLLLGALLGIPGWVLTIGCGLAALVTRRAGWVYAAALFAIGPLVYFAATPRFQYVAPVGIVLAIVAVLVLRRKGDVRAAAALATVPLVAILAWMLVSAVITGQI